MLMGGFPKALASKTGTTYNFVITILQPFSATNLTVKISFSRVVLERGILTDVLQF